MSSFYLVSLYSSDTSPNVSKLSEVVLGVNYGQFHIQRKEGRKRRQKGGRKGGRKGEKREGRRKEGGGRMKERKKESIYLIYLLFWKRSFQRSLG